MSVKLTFYTLAIKTEAQLCRPKCREIVKLTPKLDRGWLVVRQHESAEALRGYVDAHTDASRLHEERLVSTYETGAGFFSLLYRERVKDAPDCLLIYIFREEVDQSKVYELPLAETHSFVIRHPNGKTTYDPSLIFPHLMG